MKERDTGTDAELDAECRVLGAMLVGKLDALGSPLFTDSAFCSDFHAAVYFAFQIARKLPGGVTPEAIWDRVKDHPDSEHFGLQHIIDLMTTAASEAKDEDLEIMVARASRLLMAEAEPQNGTFH